MLISDVNKLLTDDIHFDYKFEKKYFIHKKHISKENIFTEERSQIHY